MKPFPSGEVVQGDITDFDSMLEATKGMDGVVHLALVRRGDRRDRESAHPDMVGTYHVFVAARRSGLNKVVFASSNHACGYAVEELANTSPSSNKTFGEMAAWIKTNFEKKAS